MLEIAIMEPPEGDCEDICVAAAWTAKNAPDRLVVMVALKREGSSLAYRLVDDKVANDEWQTLGTPRIYRYPHC